MTTINTQFNEMINRGTMPIFEFTLPNDEFLIVDININEKGVLFSFDSNSLPVSFDGDVEVISANFYLLPFDECFDHLDSYLEMIHSNLVEGYLIPNDLFISE